MHHILLQQQQAAQAANQIQGQPTQQAQPGQGQQAQPIAQPGQQGGAPQQATQLQGHPSSHQPALQNTVAGQQPHLKDYEQPRFYTSPMIIQQPSYLLMNPPNSQYVNQSIIYPGYQGQQQVGQVGQMGQMNQQQVQQYFESVPVNNYMLMPGQAASTNNNANTSATSTPAAANSAITNNNTNSYYGPTSGSYSQPPHLGPHYSIPPTGHLQQSQLQPQPQQPHVNQHIQSQVPKAPSAVPASAPKNTAPILFSNFPERLQQLLPAPPLSLVPVRPEISYSLQQKRAKRKSKFSKVQDDLIVTLKKKGKSWVEIAEISGVGSYLAARNRYQVIVGQQGNNNSSSWNQEDKVHLQNVLDAGELEKWRFIALELNRATNKNFTALECREITRMMFWADPGSFGVNEDTINECLKEKKMTEKASEQRDQQLKKDHDLKDDDVKDDKTALRPNPSSYYSLAGSSQSAGSGASQALPMPAYQMGINNFVPSSNGTSASSVNNPSANPSNYGNYQKQHYY